MYRAFRIEIPDWYRGDDEACVSLSCELGEAEDKFFSVPYTRDGGHRLKTYTSECSRFTVWEGAYGEGWAPGQRLEALLMRLAAPGKVPCQRQPSPLPS